MIRFNCPHCNRFYELPPALGLLPLVCKQCGNRITPPAPSAEPTPPPKPVAPAKPPTAELVKPPPKPQAAEVTKAASSSGVDVLLTKPADGPDIDFNVSGPTAASLSDATRAKPPGLSDTARPRPAEPDTAGGGVTSPRGPTPAGDQINRAALGPEPSPRPTRRAAKPPAPAAPGPQPDEKPRSALLPFLADLIALVALLVFGMLLGEFLAKKPTGAVLSELGSAPKFPPVELLLWAGPAALLALLYLLLSGRQMTAGAWLRKRNR